MRSTITACIALGLCVSLAVIAQSPNRTTQSPMQIGIATCAHKARGHFRRGHYEHGVAGTILEVDAPGLGPADLSTNPYKNIRKDLYPLVVK